MTTKLTKPVSRVSNIEVRDGSKLRPLIVTITPGGLLLIRPQGTRRTEIMAFDTLYSLAVKQRVNAERAIKKARGKK